MGFTGEGVVLVGVAVAFAASMGAHYTGACMGMPRAAGAIRTGPALLLMAPLTLLGAVFASGAVERTVGHGILGGPTVGLVAATAIVAAAFGLTSLFNVAKLPTSTIQILVFSAVGVGLAAGLPVEWSTIGTLLVLWALAPVASFLIGFGAIRLWDARAWSGDRGPEGVGPIGRGAALGLVGVGSAASFAMGANDVANASGALVMTGLFGLMMAGFVGGLGLAIGVLTWGRPLLETVAFDVVTLDPRTAVTSQLSQSAVVLVYVASGYFTSLNQALVGAMLGVGYGRRRSGENRIAVGAVRRLLVGWAVGPAAGALTGFALYALMHRAGF